MNGRSDDSSGEGVHHPGLVHRLRALPAGDSSADHQDHLRKKGAAPLKGRGLLSNFGRYIINLKAKRGSMPSYAGGLIGIVIILAAMFACYFFDKKGRP